MNPRPASERLGLDRPLSRTAGAALVLGLVALWLLGRRYTGLTHDASVYVVQALRQLDPGAFDGDLFFRFGSQDAYTLFPQLYAPLVAALGAGPAATAVTCLGQGLFLASAAALVCRLAPGRARWWSLVLLASVSGYYGGVGVFGLLLGGNYLDYFVLAHDTVHGQERGIFWVEVGVAITVSGVMMQIFYMFAGRQRDRDAE